MRNIVKYNASSLIGNHRLAPFVFCWHCNNWCNVVIRAYVSHRYKNGQVSVDPKATKDLIAFVQNNGKYVCVEQWRRQDEGDRTVAHGELSEDSFHYDLWVNLDYDEHHKKLFSHEIVFLCPNCNGIMSGTEKWVELVCGYGDDYFMDEVCSGCYICGYIGDRSDVLNTCVECVGDSIGSDTELPDCSECLKEFGKKHYGITMAEIIDNCKD